MATALQLVNRVRRQLRWGDTASLARDDDKAILDAVNAAVAVLFETWDWECDKRHDGVLRTSASRTDTGWTVTKNSTTVAAYPSDAGAVATAICATDNATEPVLMLVVTDDTTFGDTAHRVASVQTVTDFVNTYTTLTLTNAYPGATQSLGAAIRLCANEYVLPSTVRKAISFRHQETDVRLEPVERAEQYDRWVTRPHETISDTPEMVIVGGTATSTNGSTVSGSTATGASNVSALVYPTPSTSLVLHYSYLIKHSDMSATTDTLANVDRALEDFVVQLAYARCVNNFVGDADPQAGLALEQRVMNMARAYYANQGKDPNRRYRLGSNFCENVGGVEFGTWPRNFGTGT